MDQLLLQRIKLTIDFRINCQSQVPKCEKGLNQMGFGITDKLTCDKSDRSVAAAVHDAATIRKIKPEQQHDFAVGLMSITGPLLP